jgi:MoaA/NifB/PqqE/SkfB family radical SAM enzyme
VAFNWEEAQTAFLDEDEFKILDYLRSNTASAEEVARETKISSRKCAKFLKRALKSGYVTESESASATRLQERTDINRELFARFQIPFLSAPSSVDVFVTSRCNLKCVHCFAARQESVDMPSENLKSIFDQLEKMGVLEVRINGGEPLLHPDIGKILPMLEHRRFRKVILTNGTLLTDEIAQQLKRSNVIPTISIDDSDARGHDLFRGVDGAFQKTLAGLKTLLKNGVHYGINCCLHAKNLNKIENIVKLAADYDACRIAFLDLKPLGSMRNHKEWIPSQREYEAAMARLLIARVKYRKMIDVSLDAFLFCDVLKESTFEAKK